jgi:hypothetical protein
VASFCVVGKAQVGQALGLSDKMPKNVDELPRVKAESQEIFKESRKDFQAGEDAEFVIDLSEENIEAEILPPIEAVENEPAEAEQSVEDINIELKINAEGDIPAESSVDSGNGESPVESEVTDLPVGNENIVTPTGDDEGEINADKRQEETSGDETIKIEKETAPEKEILPEPEVSVSRKFIGGLAKILGITAARAQSSRILKTEVINPSGEKMDAEATIREEEGKIIVGIDQPERSFVPGRYKLTVEILSENQDKVLTASQDFTWGVLAINANKSIYAPGEKGNLAIAVLDEKGNMVCSASLKLKIKNKKLNIDDELSTENEKIIVNPACNKKEFALEPDYEAEYEFGKEGTYELTLTAETQNGTHEITDSIEVKKDAPFDVERITATRIYPPENYPVVFNIVANQKFKGKIIETVPAIFEIVKGDGEEYENFDEEETKGTAKLLSWDVDLKKGDKLTLGYQFKAPMVSPEFYLLGPLEFNDGNDVVFEEARHWQIAADATPAYAQMIDSFTIGAGSAWTDYDIYTNKSIPKGAVVEIVLSNNDTGAENNMGVRTDGSGLNRYISIHESEAGGKTTISMLVKVHDTTGLIEAYTESTSCVFDIVGYWTGVDFTEAMSETAVSTTSSWTDIDLGTNGSRVHHVALTGAENNVNFNGGLRTNGSSIERRLETHEQEAGGRSGFSWYVKSDASDIIDYYIDDATTKYVTDLGYFGATLNFVEGFTRTAVPSTGSWQDVDLSSYLDQDGRTAAYLVSHNEEGNERNLGVRTNATAIDRYVLVHEAESSDGTLEEHTGYTACVVSDASGIIDVYQANETEADDDGFYFTGYFVPVSVTITVSGGCFTDAGEGTACTDDGSNAVKVAVNGVVEANSDSTVDGDWSFIIDQPLSGATMVFFIDGEDTESEEATTVVKYDGDGGNVTNVKMYQSQLVIGADAGSANSDQTIATVDLETTSANGYENGDDEDVLFSVASSDLTVDASGNKTETLYIISGDTYRPASGGGGDTTTHYLYNEGTITADNNAFYVAGNFSTIGTFTGGTSTITFNGTAAQTITPGGIISFNNVIFNNSSGSNPNISYTAGLSIGGNVTLGNTTNIASTNNTNFTVSSTINSTDSTDRALSINSGTGDVSISMAIGSTNDLASLTIVGNDITLTNIGILSAGVSGATSITSTDNGGDFGTLTLSQSTYNTNAATYTGGSSGGISITGSTAVFTTSADNISFTNTVTLGDIGSVSVTTSGSSPGSGDITIGTITGTSNEGITLNASSANVTIGTVGSESNLINTVAITGTTITLSGNIYTSDASGNTVTLTGAVALGAGVTIDTNETTNDGNVSFTSTINSSDTTDRALSIATGVADISVSGAIGATNDLASITFTGNDITLASIGAGSAGVTGVTSITSADNGGDFGILTLNGTVYNTNAATYTSGSSGGISITGTSPDFITSVDTITFSNTATLGNIGDISVATSGSIPGSGNIQFGAIRGTSDEDINLNASSAAVVVNLIGDETANEINTIDITGATVNLNGNIYTSDAAGNTVTLSGAVLIYAGVTIDTNEATNDGNVSITSTINSSDTTDRALSIAAGSADISVAGAIGATNDLASLTIAGNDITLANIGGGAAGVTGATSVTGDATGTITLTGTTYNTSGTQAYNAGGAARTITLNENTAFTTTDDTIGFTGVVNSQASENNTVALNAGTAQVTFNNNVGAATALGVLTKQGAGDMKFGSNTLACAGLTLSAGTINTLGTDSGAWTVNGNLLISSGTLKSTTNNLSVSGNWANGGTFTANNGTVTLSGAGASTQEISGDNTFYNLTAQAASARTLKFESDKTQAITNTLDIDGSAGQFITLTTISGTTPWKINPTSAATVTYVDVNYSNDIGAAICAASSQSTNDNNSVGWTITANPSCNASPDTPTNPGPAGYIDAAGWMNDNTPTVNFDITDPDPSEQVKYRIQIDDTSGFGSPVLDYQPTSYGAEGTYYYTVGQAGSYAVGSESMTLSDSAVGGGYYWKVKAIDDNLAESAFEEAGTDGTIDFRVDATAPTEGTVNDGTSGDDDWNNGSLTQISGNWTGFNADTSGLQKYEYAIRHEPDDYYWDGDSWESGQTWNENGDTDFTNNSMNLQTGVIYYVSVKATDNAGNTATAVDSDGQQVLPLLSFSLGSTSLTFANLNDSNNWTDSKTLTTTTSTNASNGYTIKSYETQLLTSLAYPSQTISDFSGTWNDPLAWNPGTYGFGYTSSDNSVQGSNRFNNATEYAAFLHEEDAPGNVVADHTDAVNGSTGAVSGEVFTITYKVSTSQTQAASQYRTYTVYIVTANY